MRLALILLILLHALIHLLGFAKGVGWAEIPQLRQPIGVLGGIGWLVAALLLVLSGALLWAGEPRWWWAAGAGLVVSQAMILGAWSDARVGTVPNVLIAVPVLLALADLRGGSLRSEYRAAVHRLVAESPTAAPAVVTEADLAPLPTLVSNYLRRAGVVGQPRVVNLRATFQAEMRNGRDAPAMSASVEMYEFFGPRARLFYMSASRSGVPFAVFHRYVGTEASMRVRVAGLVPMIDASGPIMTQSETVTLFNDMCILAPATLIDSTIEWSAVDATHVRATFANAGHRIAAVLTFDAAGDLINFRSEDRHQYDGKVDRLVHCVLALLIGALLLCTKLI